MAGTCKENGSGSDVMKDDGRGRRKEDLF